MVRAPPARVAMLNVASPAPCNVADPIVAAPSLKVTVPVGMPDPVDVTVAVNVTACPNIEGFGEEVSVVEVAAFAKPGVVLRNIVTLLLPEFATARSGLPSPLESPTATQPGFEPAA